MTYYLGKTTCRDFVFAHLNEYIHGTMPTVRHCDYHRYRGAEWLVFFDGVNYIEVYFHAGPGAIQTRLRAAHEDEFTGESIRVYDEVTIFDWNPSTKTAGEMHYNTTKSWQELRSGLQNVASMLEDAERRLHEC